MPSPVRIVNPLPSTLDHYARSVEEVLLGNGVATERAETPSGEVGDLGAIRKVLRGAHIFGSHRKLTRSSPRDLLTLWPIFGSAEPATWPHSQGTTTIVWHDAKPLRRTHLSGRAFQQLGAAAQRARQIRIVVHSDLAAREVREMGYHVSAVVSHPFREVTRSSTLSVSNRILVAGQYKPSRDLQILSAIGPRLRRAGFRPVIVGSGWPDIDGWDVTSRFVSESELTEELASARAVLIPYAKVYQSGIAVRAAELGTAVVGPARSNVEQIFGVDWPGLVTSDAPEAWFSATTSVCQLHRDEVNRGIVRWKTDVRESWRLLAQDSGWLA